MNRYSKAALAFCCLLLLLTGIFYYPKWNQHDTEATISWDASGYYMYLPAIFIYKDLKQCSFRDSIIEKYKPSPQFDQAFQHSSGNYVMKYSSGQAIILSPFFFAAHFITKNLSGYPADGFSFPYQLAIGIGALFYALLGLFILRKTLLNYFSDKATAITLVCITFASNYLNYAAIDGAMTHNTLFTLYSLLIYTTINFYKFPSTKKAILIGTIVGLATLTRPTEIISLFIPLLWGINGRTGFKQRIHFFNTSKKYLVPGAICMLVISSIQFFYWKYATGQWIVYSYQEEGFSFLKPHIINCMFSFRSGWLIYSPIMILPLIGFIYLYKNFRHLFFTTFIFSILFIYICFSWDVWWYGGSLGQRAMVQAYPILAFPMAALITSVLSLKKIYKIIFISFVVFCTWYNLWITHQAHKGGLFVPGEMTKAYFFAIFGKSKVDARVITLLDNKYLFDTEQLNPELVYENDFEEDSSQNIETENAIEGNSIYLNHQIQFSKEYIFTLPLTTKTRIRASADFRATQKEWDTWKMTQFILKFYDNDKLVKTNQVRVFRVLNDGETKNILLDASIPGKKFNRVAVVFWNAESDKKIIIDNLKVYIF